MNHNPQVLLDTALYEYVLGCTGASAIGDVEAVQSLWSGFGQIVRLDLEYANSHSVPPIESVIVKCVTPPEQECHPRGWDSDVSTQRKLESYQVESRWYQLYAASCHDICPVPKLYASHVSGRQTWLILEDLDTRFPDRHSQLNIEACKPCLRWLARFHAHHYQHAGEGLWPTGTYWHLQTRSDEFNAMPASKLKLAAQAFDAALNSCPSQTLVHGDAKVANFCFSSACESVAMVDFQYTGRGCGIRDVAYFLGSCLTDSDCEQYADALLDVYFAELRDYLPLTARQIVEDQWRDLYAIAWADFNRFLSGWMPGHRKMNRYMQVMTEQALAQL